MLAFALFLPLLGFFLILFAPKGRLPFQIAFATTILTFLSSLGLIGPALINPAQLTSTINALWVDVPDLAIRFHLGVDGVNLWLVVLTGLLLLIAVWISDITIAERSKNFFALLLLFEFGLIGVFTAADLFVFYVFWEVALVPMYLMVGGWGSGKRGAAAVKFFVYTFLGSVLMLGSILYLHAQVGTFDYVDIMNGLGSGRFVLTSTQQLYLFLGFFAAFAVKVPIFPLHTWLPNTYTQAPTPATFLLAAIMSKMGAYGLVRYSITLAPAGAHRCANWIAALAIIGIIYGALIALIQPNIKRLIAYSSVSHLGFIVLGIFTFSQQGADGAVYQMIAHGLSTGALFVLCGYLEIRRKSLEIDDFGGWANAAPRLAVSFMIALLASIGLPTLCNFIGEFLVLQGAATAQFKWSVWASIGVILSAAYMLWMYGRVFLGKLEKSVAVSDLNTREWAPVLVLTVFMVWLGTYTQSFMPPITSATAHLLDQASMGNEYRVSSPARLAEVRNAR